MTITKYKKSKDIINMFAGFVFILLLVSFTLSFASIDFKVSVGNATKNRSFANVTQLGWRRG